MTVTATFHDLRDASVFITGGGSGIGASITDGFLAQGAKVAFVGRSDATVQLMRLRRLMVRSQRWSITPPTTSAMPPKMWTAIFGIG